MNDSILLSSRRTRSQLMTSTQPPSSSHYRLSGYLVLHTYSINLKPLRLRLSPHSKTNRHVVCHPCTNLRQQSRPLEHTQTTAVILGLLTCHSPLAQPAIPIATARSVCLKVMSSPTVEQLRKYSMSIKRILSRSPSHPGLTNCPLCLGNDTTDWSRRKPSNLGQCQVMIDLWEVTRT